MSDLPMLRQHFTSIVTSLEKTKEFKVRDIQMQDALAENETLARLELGEWLADYFADAGYTNWHSFVDIFKMMIVNAMPPLLPLDGTKKRSETIDTEEVLIKFLNVISAHIDVEKHRDNPCKSFMNFARP